MSEVEAPYPDPVEEFPRGEPFSSRGLLEKNLDAMERKLVGKDNKDLIIIVVGSPGNGKSSLTYLCGKYLKPDQDILDQTDFTHEAYMKEIKNGEKNKFINYDEGYNSFYRRNATTKENKEAMSTLWKFRFKNHVHFINFQNLKDIETDLLYQRAHAVIRVVKKGWIHFFSQKTARDIEIDNDRGVEFPDPDFRDGFPDPANVYPDEWETYEERNEEALNEEDAVEEKVTYIRPGEAAERIGVSRTTIHNWCEKEKLEYATLFNGDRRIPEKELENLIDEEGGEQND